MHCPLHDDHNRSASVNLKKGFFYCNVCQQRGITIQDIAQHLLDHPELEPPNTRTKWTGKSAGNSNGYVGDLTEGQVAGWASALLSNQDMLMALADRRGLERSTIIDYEIGWDSSTQAYTIPVRSREGDLLNVRRYQLDPTDDRRKIWSIAGRGAPVLYPWHEIEGVGDWVIICEGELDALLTIQNGFPAVTRTGAAGVWKATWNAEFQGKMVYLAHDADTAGQDANRLVAAALEGVASEIYCLKLPYETLEKHGKDLTDYWLEGHTPQDFYQLLFQAEPWGNLEDSALHTLQDITLLESFDAANLGQRLRTRVTITGKQSPTYILPEKVEYKCDMSNGMKCAVCPMNAEGHNGFFATTISRDNPLILKCIGYSDTQVDELLRKQVTPIKCPRLQVVNAQAMSVEELFVRPSVEHYRINEDVGDYTSRKIISVGRHDTLPNNTVEIVGTIYPNPRTQHNEFQAWEVNRTETSVDRFELTPELVEMMKTFRPGRLQSPLHKLGDISKDLALHVTQIYGRNIMHAVMDLTFHSVIAYDFDGKLEPRGWLDTLVVGDTRTGKTEAVKRMIEFFGAGEYVSCEAASFAGVVGGLQQQSGKEWTVTWGAVPINDRRLVALDEVSGLTTEQIAQMSSIRSSGEAQLTKIQSERTFARTRLLWLGNPRDGKSMGGYTYGMQAIVPLIGNNEDVARFDLAMSVAANEVTSEEINRQHRSTPQKYSEEACQALLRWVWSRKAHQVVWAKGTVEDVYKGAINMGERYIEDPPLVQAANIRMKITRVAVALAARLFSTPKDDPEKVLVCREHVRDAMEFMDHLYDLPGFGYGERSKQAMKDRKQAEANIPAAREYIQSRKGLSRFIVSLGGQFRRSDMEDVLNYQREEANNVVNILWEYRMVTRRREWLIVSPELHSIVRELNQ